MLKGKIGTKTILPLGTAIVGLVFALVGFFKYGFWDENIGTQPGFFPAIVGILLFAISILALLQSFKDEKNSSKKENWYPVLAVVLIIAGNFIFGMYISIFAFLIYWVRFYEKSSWKVTIIITAIMFVIVVGAFGTWLNINFPKGLLYNLIF